MCAMSDIIDPITTLVAAFAGAWFAFLFERKHKQNEENARQIAAGNRALYTIFNLWNVQAQIKKEVIDPHRGRSDAWLNMAANFPSRYGLTVFEAGELSFLLGKESTLYSNLLLEEQRFDLAIQLVESRSRTILNEAWPRLAAAEVGIGDARESTEIEHIVGVDTTRKLKIFTEGIITNIDENLASLVKVHDELRKVLLELFPNQKFIKVEFSSATRN